MNKITIQTLEEHGQFKVIIKITLNRDVYFREEGTCEISDTLDKESLINTTIDAISLSIKRYIARNNQIIIKNEKD